MVNLLIMTMRSVFEDYGTITMSLVIIPSNSDCPVEAFITDSDLSVSVTTDSMQLNREDVEHVFVEPRAYGLRLIATNNGIPTLRVQDLDCDSVSYVLTIAPA